MLWVSCHSLLVDSQTQFEILEYTVVVYYPKRTLWEFTARLPGVRWNESMNEPEEHDEENQTYFSQFVYKLRILKKSQRSFKKVHVAFANITYRG